MTSRDRVRCATPRKEAVSIPTWQAAVLPDPKGTKRTVLPSEAHHCAAAAPTSSMTVSLLGVARQPLMQPPARSGWKSISVEPSVSPPRKRCKSRARIAAMEMAARIEVYFATNFFLAPRSCASDASVSRSAPTPGLVIPRRLGPRPPLSPPRLRAHSVPVC